MMAKQSTYEKNIERLNEISTLLERGDVPLEELLKAFEEGIKLYRVCHSILETTESKIQTILDEGNEV